MNTVSDALHALAALLDYTVPAGLLVLFALPSLLNHRHERRIDRQLRDAARGGDAVRRRTGVGHRTRGGPVALAPGTCRARGAGHAA
ncbi:hypothetical protein ACWGJ2_22770 [Streptomyces sp. NPDC054796]